MLRKIVLSVFSMAVLFCIQAAAQTPAPAKSEGNPSVDEIISKHVKARGGLDKIKAVKTVKMTGKVVVQGGAFEIPVLVQLKRPNSFRRESTLQGKSAIMAFDGTTGWQTNPFQGSSEPERMSDDDIKEAQEDSDAFEGPLVDFKTKGHTVELVGKEDVEGTETYKLKVTLKSGTTSYVYLDTQNFLELKTTSKRKSQGSEIEIDNFYGNYKEVNGLVLPHAIDNKIKGNTVSQIVVEKIEFDVPIDDSVFKMPAKSAEKAPEKK